MSGSAKRRLAHFLNLAFTVDILTHMNGLKVNLQGKDQFVHKMCTNEGTLKAKLTLFSRHKSFVHFPTLTMLKEAPLH